MNYENFLLIINELYKKISILQKIVLKIIVIKIM